MTDPLDVLAVGHALVDVTDHITDETIDLLELTKGTMELVDGERAAAIRAALGPGARAVSGGSAANTAVGVASFGGRAGFVGRVADDELGRFFAEDIRATGVRFEVPPAGTRDVAGTGTSLVLVTPDAEKTMCTSLGAGAHLAAADVDPEAVAAAQVVYLEGYLCGDERAERAVEAVLASAAGSGTRVALSLSDPAWVALKRDALAAAAAQVDLIFANEHEALGLTGAPSLDEAVDGLARRGATVVVTRGAAGSVVAEGADRWEIPAAPVPNVVDTNGAGDLFAAGYLWSMLRGDPPDVAARVGGVAAAEVVGHLGARPERPLRGLLAG